MGAELQHPRGGQQPLEIRERARRLQQLDDRADSQEAQALAHPQAAARGLLVETPHPTAGNVRTIGSPMGFERATFTDLPPPRLGEHSRVILREVLGYDEARVEALTTSGAVLVESEAQ